MSYSSTPAGSSMDHSWQHSPLLGQLRPAVRTQAVACAVYTNAPCGDDGGGVMGMSVDNGTGLMMPYLSGMSPPQDMVGTPPVGGSPPPMLQGRMRGQRGG